MTASRAVQRASVELRFTEVRATSSASGKRLEGYAAVFNTPTQLPGFREVIKPGAFTRAIEDNHDCVCLFNHDQNNVLGRTTSGTLRLDQDSRGLHYVCDLPNTQAARDAHELIKRGDVVGSSFGFTVAPEGQDWSNETDEDGTQYILRAIKDVKLMDVSPVVSPAYGGTKVVARSAVIPPIELRAKVNAHNTGFRMPTFEECLEITRRAAERKQHEIRMRRMNLLNNLIH
jgi:HK97 family phage prohead protease